MDAEEVEQALKVVVVGDGGVGKSSLIRRYCRGVFTSQYKKTIGVDFLERVVTLGEGRQVRPRPGRFSGLSYHVLVSEFYDFHFFQVE